jgi:hypothetical protein
VADAEDRALAEDYSSPVAVEPGVDYAAPKDWAWRGVSASQPSRATFHLNHSDVGRVMVDVIQPSDCPPGAPFVLSRDIPIIILDSLDKYWAGESRSRLPLHGLRVPIADDTVEGAKRALAADLAAQLRLLLLLSSSRRGKLAPQLKANLDCLKSFMAPAREPHKPQGEATG